MLACSGARSFALSLLERRGGLGEDGATPPSHEVEWEGQVCIVGPCDPPSDRCF